MKRLFKQFKGLIIALAIATTIMALSPAIPALALTTADVTVNATPSFVGIAVNISDYAFGTVTTSTNYSTVAGYFGIDNTSTVVTNQTIKVNGDWTGGVAWTAADNDEPGADTAVLLASKGDGSFGVVVKKSAAFEYIAVDQGATTDYSFELRLSTPTSFSDGVLKTNTVRITAAAV